MKQLPEKWAIKTDEMTDEMLDEFYDWLEKTGLFAAFKYEDNKLVAVYYPSTADISNHEEITIEQWREAVKYGWKELKSDELITGGELEGYEAPFDMYNGRVKKGELFSKDNEDAVYWKFNNGSMHEFPAEIVEKYFIPRYKAKEKKRVVKSGWVIVTIEIIGGEFDSVDKTFNTQADCIEWVRKKGEEGKYYTYQEVDYITEE